MSASVFADCTGGMDGQIVQIKVQSCEEIQAESNSDVQKYAGSYYKTWNLKKLYTGALVKEPSGVLWMYPSDRRHPCKEFRKGSVVNKKGYSSCCDTGRWGKCVFGGNFLGDVDGKPINAYQ